MSQTVRRAAAILRSLALEPRRGSEIARELGVHDSTAARLLATLEGEGLIYREADKRYRLGAGLFYLAQQGLQALDLRRVAAPEMHRLAGSTGETVHLGVLEGRNIVYIEKVDSPQAVRMYSNIGRIAPLHCTAVAKALVAFLPEDERESLIDDVKFERFTPHTLEDAAALRDNLALTRARGYATDEQEHEVGIHCIAAPISGPEGRPVGSMSVTALASRLPFQSLIEHVSELRESTQVVSTQIGGNHSEDKPSGQLQRG